MASVNSDLSKEQKAVYQVQFVGVGRGGIGWTQVVERQPDEVSIERMVKKKKALASRSIECIFDEDMEHGVIVAGWREVGAFRVTEVRT